MERVWTKESITKLIRLYKDQPLLYDTAHPYYGKLEKYPDAYAEIVEGMITVMPGLTMKDVHDKITYLGGQFMNSVAYIESNHAKRPWYYDEISFLLNMHDENIVEIEIPVNEIAHTKKNGKDKHIIRTVSRENQRWTKDRVRTLIRLYKERPVLYDINHPNFCKDKNHVYNEIVEAMIGLMPKLTEHKVRIKIKTLRTQFKKSLKLRHQTKRSLWCSKELSFLKNYLELSNVELQNSPDHQTDPDDSLSDSSSMESMEDESVDTNDSVPQSNRSVAPSLGLAITSADQLCEEKTVDTPLREFTNHSNSSSLGLAITSADQLCEEKTVGSPLKEFTNHSNASLGMEITSTDQLCEVKTSDTALRDDETIHAETVLTPTIDEVSLYAEAWAATFRKLSEEQQMFAKVDIEGVLMLGQLGRLKFPD